MQKIKDYFLIGDLHTAALVSARGSVDWLCFPHFDSPSVFAALLDRDAGCFSIEADGYRAHAEYVKDTAIVEILFENGISSFKVRDFMVPRPDNRCDTHYLVRTIIGGSGASRIKLKYNPRPEYSGRDAFTDQNGVYFQTQTKNGTLFFLPSENSSVRQTPDGLDISVNLKEGESAQFIIEFASDNEIHKNGENFESETRNFWEKWVRKGKYFDFCRDELVRSAITLKLMQFYPTGAIIAAPTTSLPETVGGERNWDYRYTWVRDATFTLYALYVLGYQEEAAKYFEFVERIAKDCEECNINVELFYTIDGKPVPEEETLPHFRGYENSKPVRIGNGARDQFQLDIYGSLIDAHYFMSRRGIKPTGKTKEIILDLAEKIRMRWHDPDNGIWEVRGGRERYAYSRVMAWVGVDRVIRMCGALGIADSKKKELQKLADEIKIWIWKKCYDEQRGVFKQHPNTAHQDATNFLFVLLQFLDRHDEKTRAIILNTCRELRYSDVFVYRYFTEDGLEGKEGAFVLCSFWLISAFSMIGETEEAMRIFSIFQHSVSESGLLSEEIDPNTLGYLGNYPQAFSHIGFIMSAYYIDRYKKRGKK